MARTGPLSASSLTLQCDWSSMSENWAACNFGHELSVASGLSCTTFGITSTKAKAGASKKRRRVLVPIIGVDFRFALIKYVPDCGSRQIIS